MKRRDWLKSAALAWSGAFLPWMNGCGGADAPKRPKRIIFMISDGMSPGVPALAEAFSLLSRKRSTAWHQLAQSKETTLGQFDMASLNSLVTDSAAAASAWGSGRRVANGTINQYPDGTLLLPLIPRLHGLGWRTGLVTTARITHATPAGFAANVSQRDSEDEIAAQYLDTVDVLLGGGSVFFDGEYRLDGRDLRGEFQTKGYHAFSDRASLVNSGSSSRKLGLFGADHLPYMLDWQTDERLKQQVPTLREMTEAALRTWSAQESFFLMIEGARIDHAAHANDAAALLAEQLAFDDTLETVLAYAKANPDTLLVVSSDHGNANPGLNGMGTGYAASNLTFRRVAEATESFTNLQQRLGEIQRKNPKVKLTPSAVAEEVRRATGYLPDPDQAATLLLALEGKPFPTGNLQHANFFGLLGELTGNYTGIGWTGTTHTSDWTPILATGPGQELFHGLHANTDFFRNVMELSGVTGENPEYRGAAPVPPEVPAANQRADTSA